MFEGVAEQVKSIIDRVGRDVTHRVVTNSGTDFDPTQSEVDTTIVAAFAAFTIRESESSLVQTGDKKAFIDSTVVINKADKIADGSIEYQIVDVREVAPGADTFLYIAHLRK